MNENEVVIDVKGLVKYFELKKGFLSLFRKPLFVKAVDGVSFNIHAGEIVALVGESGCGKTTVGRLITRLENPTAGSIDFMGKDIATLKGGELNVFRKKIQMIFQDPYESLNPRFTVFRTVVEPLVTHKIELTTKEKLEKVVKALEDAGLKKPEELLGRFPHELSGGQRQRVAVARTLVIDPKCIIADEPVSMLDVSIRAGVMNLMLDLKEKYQMPYLFITHEISVARYMSDRIAVMYLGKIVEIGETDEVIRHPVHPYTRALISVVPVADPDYKHGKVPIRGELPSPIDLPEGCRFHPRCLYAKDICREGRPELNEKETVEEEWPPVIDVGNGHLVQCHFAKELHAEGYTIGAQDDTV